VAFVSAHLEKTGSFKRLAFPFATSSHQSHDREDNSPHARTSSDIPSRQGKIISIVLRLQDYAALSAKLSARVGLECGKTVQVVAKLQFSKH
jgi:hypothetical protein